MVKATALRWSGYPFHRGELLKLELKGKVWKLLVQEEMTMSKTSSDILTEWWNGWVRTKEEAIQSGDYSFYLSFLKEAQKDFSQLYSELEMEEALSLVEMIIKQITIETKWVNGKIKEKDIPF